MRTCPQCGEENPARARFCLACGTPFPESAEQSESRRTVTVLFADLVDSTAITEGLDPEAHRRVQSRFFEELRGVLERHGGTVEKYIGDAVMAVFGMPAVHEDDALRAVRAATEMREALAALNNELRRSWNVDLSVRTGINTGEVVAGDPTAGQRLVTGDAVNVGSRLEAAASAGEILIGDDTYRLVRNAVLVEPVEALELKGKAEPVTAWRVLAVLAGAPSVARRLDAPIVDRERELAILSQAFDHVAAERVCHLVTLLGPAGVGKSRLTLELFSMVEARTNILTGRCLPYGEGITFWPVVEVVKRAVGITAALSPAERRQRLAAALAGEREAEVAVEHLAALVGAGKPRGNAEQTFWAVRKLLEALAREKPLTVAFEDVHWGEETFLDLIEHVADRSHDAPILIVCLARPEFLEDRPAWGGGKLNATSLLLGPLGEEDAGALLDNLLEAEIPREVKQRIVDAAEGNPLYVEEMLAMLIDDGVLRRDDGRWVAAGDLSAITVPPTIQALIAARLDRLTDREKAVLERAAVAGKVFSRGAVRALSPRGEDVTEPLESLVRKQLVRPHRAVFAGEETFRFRHILIRDAAYQGMSKDARAELHERFATWLERAGSEQLAEYEEILGYHLEQAHRFRAEVGPAELVPDLAHRAARHIASAGRRAFARSDMPAAVGLLTRATLLLSDEPVARAGLAPELGTALIETAELARADGVLSGAIEIARQAGDGRLEAHAKMAWIPCQVRLSSRPRSEETLRVAQEALAVFEELGDELGLAEAWRGISEVHWMASRWRARTEALERALGHARRAGSRRDEIGILAALGLSLLWGPTPVEEGIERFRAILEEVADDPVLEAHVVADRAGLEAMLGHFAEAREDYLRGKRIFQDHGLTRALGAQTIVLGGIELLAGNPEAAEAELRTGCEIAEGMGNRGSLATLAPVLADALYAQGRYDEAEHFVTVSKRYAPPDDIASQILWRAAEAKLLAQMGRAEDGERLALEALALAEDTDALNLRADTLVSLAEVKRLRPGRDSVAEPLRSARELYRRKGNVVAARKVEASLAEL